jgi:hypothetical protein
MPDDPSSSTFDPREVVAFREFRSMQVPALLSTSEHLSHLLTTSTTPYTQNDIKAVVGLHEHVVKHIARDDVQQTFLVGEAALHGLSGPQLATCFSAAYSETSLSGFFLDCLGVPQASGLSSWCPSWTSPLWSFLNPPRTQVGCGSLRM